MSSLHVAIYQLQNCTNSRTLEHAWLNNFWGLKINHNITTGTESCVDKWNIPSPFAISYKRFHILTRFNQQQHNPDHFIPTSHSPRKYRYWKTLPNRTSGPEGEVCYKTLTDHLWGHIPPCSHIPSMLSSNQQFVWLVHLNAGNLWKFLLHSISLLQTYLHSLSINLYLDQIPSTVLPT